MRMRLPGLARPMVALTLVLVLAGCGSKSTAATADPAAAAAVTSTADDSSAADNTTAADAGTKGDPCRWFTAAEMSKILGFTVTVAAEETPMGYKSECAYNSDAEFTKVTILPMSAAQYDSLKKGMAAYSTKVPVAVTGVGDDAYDDSRPDQTNGSLSLSAKKGGEAVQLSLATANDKIKDLATARKIVVPVAQKVLGG